MHTWKVETIIRSPLLNKEINLLPLFYNDSTALFCVRQYIRFDLTNKRVYLQKKVKYVKHWPILVFKLFKHI